MEALVKQLVEVNIAQQAMHWELLEEQRQQTALLRSELSQLPAAQTGIAAGAAVSRSKPSRFILKLTEADDIEAYLQALRGRRLGRKGPMRNGAAQKSYQDLTADQSTHYEGLKK